MSAFDLIDRRQVAYCLTIAGLPYRYYGHLAPGAGLTKDDLIAHDDAVVAQPVDVEALVDVGPIRASIDDMKGMATQEPVTVKIRGFNARISGGGRVDPALTLLRVAGHRASENAVRLLTSLPHAVTRSGPVDVEVAADVGSWDLPGRIHIGQEVLWADGADGDGSAEDPWRFTGCTRAADGHSTQAHEVDDRANEQPWVTSDVTTWRGRYARIYVTAIVGGAAYGWRQYWAGFIDSAPELDDDDTISIRIASLAQVARYRLGVGSASRTAHAVPGAHMFTVGHADTLNMLVKYKFFESVIEDALEDLVLETTPAQDWLPLRLFEDDGSETYVVEWPKALQDAINTAAAWQPGRYKSWADPSGAGGVSSFWRFALIQDDGWVLTAAEYVDVDAGLTLIEERAVLIRGGDGVCWAGWIAGEGVADVRGTTLAVRPGWRPTPLGGISENVFYEDSAPHRIPIDGPASWFYQSGEEWIGPFDRSLYTAAAGTAQPLRITGEGTDVTVHIVEETSGTHPGTDAEVYWFRVDPRRRERTRPIVMMPSDAPFVAQVVASVVDSEPTRYLLQLLTSGIGNGDNGTHDRMPIGANLPSGLVDVNSFLAMPVPGPLARQDYTAVRGKTIEEQVEGLLLACGCQFGVRYSLLVDKWRIALVHMGAADSTQSELTIVHNDLEAREGRRRVVSRTDGRVTRSFRILLNYPTDGGEPVPVELAASSESADNGGDAGSPLTMELRGVRIEGEGDIMQAATELISDIRARVGAPRVRWEFAIRADAPGAIAIGIGSTITLTSSDARGVNPSQTASATPCRVVGLKRDLDANRLELEVRPYGGLAAGYAPSLRVESVVNEMTVVVEASAFSDDDLSRFAVDDAVGCVPLGDWAGRTSRTIVRIDSVAREVETSAGHGLVAGDVIRLDDYDAATGARAFVGGFAFLADDADTLGADADQGQIIG